MLERREGATREPADVPAVTVGIWSRRGEFLGVAEIPDGRSEESTRDHIRLSMSRGPDEEGMTFTAHPFPGGCRVRVEERWKGGEETLWLAPVEEGEEGYMGLFSEEEFCRAFPFLAASLEMPGGVEAQR